MFAREAACAAAGAVTAFHAPALFHHRV